MSFERYYDTNLKLFKSLEYTSKSLVENLINSEKLNYLSIDSRTKLKSSCLSKIKRKEYQKPIEQMHDIVGIRIIAHFQSDVSDIATLLSENLLVDDGNTSDKEEVLGTDKIGYNSTHLICELGPKRHKLAEYADISALKFEIQIRTILQHAWAELAHDKSYKFTGGLPSNIQRDLNLHSGLLEIADKAFERITREIAEYSTKIDTPTSNILDEEVNIISLESYLERHKTRIKKSRRNLDSFPEIVSELNRFGIKEIRDVDSIMTEEFLEFDEKYESNQTSLGFLRNAMMFENAEDYFSKAWNDDWSGISRRSANAFQKHDSNFIQLLENHGIWVEEDE